MRAEGIHKTFYILLIPELRNRCKSKPSGTGRKSFFAEFSGHLATVKGRFFNKKWIPNVKICSPRGSALGRTCVSQGDYKQRYMLLREMFNNHHVLSVQIVLSLDWRIALMSYSGFRRNQKRKWEGPQAVENLPSRQLPSVLILVAGDCLLA